MAPPFDVQRQVRQLDEDVRALADLLDGMSATVDLRSTRLDGNGGRLDTVRGRLDGIGGRLGTMDGELDAVLRLLSDRGDR